MTPGGGGLNMASDAETIERLKADLAESERKIMSGRNELRDLHATVNSLQSDLDRARYEIAMHPSRQMAAVIEGAQKEFDALRPTINEFIEQFMHRSRENANQILENLKKSQVTAPRFWHVTNERKAAIKLVLDIGEANPRHTTWEEEDAARNVLRAMLDEADVYAGES